MSVSFADTRIEIVRPSWHDERGALVPDFETPAGTQIVPGCSVQPGASEEMLAARQGVNVRWTVYAPPGLDVDAHDAVRYGGALYQIDGTPARWTSPTGALDHTVLLLVDFRG